jgi:hypothetical protein
LSSAPPPPPEFGETLTLLLRAIASFAGGCGFAILYNSSPRTVLAVGALALVGNELRLALHDAGMTLAPATFLGALAVEAGARPAPRLRLFLGVTCFVADLASSVAPHLARDRRWRAIQSCRDLPDRAPVGLKSGNLASVFQ